MLAGYTTGPSSDQRMVRWCIRLTRLTLVCEVIRYRMFQVWQNLKKMISFAGNSNSSIVLTLILSVVTPNLSLNTYARASIVRFSEPVMIEPARALSSWTSGCLHWPWLSASLVHLSLFLGRSLFYIEFFSSVVHELEFFSIFFYLKTCEKSRGMRKC